MVNNQFKTPVNVQLSLSIPFRRTTRKFFASKAAKPSGLRLPLKTGIKRSSILYAPDESGFRKLKKRPLGSAAWFTKNWSEAEIDVVKAERLAT